VAVDHATIPALLSHHHETRGHEPALVSDDEVLTYADLDDRSLLVARRLVGSGVNKGTRVGLLMANGVDWAVTAFGVMRVGGVLVPLSTLLRPPELEAQLHTAAVVFLIAQDRYRGRRYLDELDAQVPGITTVGSGVARHPGLASLRRVWASDAMPDDLAPGPLVAALASSVRPADDLAVMFTSGSRGRPKGVIHTHGGAIRATASGLEARRITAADRLYIPMPFFWMGGFGGGLLSTLVAGATLLTETDPTPATTIAFLERERATLFRGWPDQAARIAADPSFATADLGSLRGGSLDAVLPPAQRSSPGARANLFGMTESFGPYCGSRLDTDLPAAQRGSCGRPFEAMEVRITDPQTGTPVGVDQQGMIELRGPNLMRGFCGRRRDETFTPDDYYRSGDLGRLDADGYLFFAGRVDDMFKVSGATVYPSEVEAALRVIGFVRQAYVTDVTDASGNQAVGAVVLLADDHSIAELAAEARKRLSSFKVPSRWVLASSVQDVPTLSTGKVDKAGLQALIASTGTEVTR
jgi:acyl-CoA synthetase (AMP-forming)/AMP-acid ligase II